MLPTKLIYLENFELYNYKAKVIDIITENDRKVIILDSTIFIPKAADSHMTQVLLKTILLNL